MAAFRFIALIDVSTSLLYISRILYSSYRTQTAAYYDTRSNAINGIFGLAGVNFVSAYSRYRRLSSLKVRAFPRSRKKHSIRRRAQNDGAAVAVSSSSAASSPSPSPSPTPICDFHSRFLSFLSGATMSLLVAIRARFRSYARARSRVSVFP